MEQLQQGHQSPVREDSSTTTSTGPKIIRPIPRRPFNLALKSPTPPEESSAPGTPALHQQPKITAHDLRFLAVHNGGGFGTQNDVNSGSGNGGSASSTISRAASLMNLTSSTLFGIYSPTSPTELESRRGSSYDDRFGSPEGLAGGGGGLGGLGLGGVMGLGGMMGDEPSTPWGTGAETAARRRPGLDEETYRLMKSRSSGVASSGLAYRGPALSSPTSPIHSNVDLSSKPAGPVAVIQSLLVRGVILFALGMGYGVLVTRLPTKARNFQQQHGGGGQHQDPAPPAAGSTDLDLNWPYLIFWGCAAMALGYLLPWFDQVWEDTIGKMSKKKDPKATKGNKNTKKQRTKRSPQFNGSPNDGDLDQEDDEDDEDDEYFPSPTPSSPPQQQQESPKEEPRAGAETDWALVIRGVGAFVGILFAIRRLPWASTMQVSLSLALVNPFIWYLIDRSKPGFLLSAAVGLVGSLSVLLLGVGSFAGGFLPAPFSAAASSHPSSWRTENWGRSGNGNNTGIYSGTGNQQHMGRDKGTFTSQEDIEVGIWILSVLFCSCVCFGNIGRRLALNRGAASRGRWGGVR